MMLSTILQASQNVLKVSAMFLCVTRPALPAYGATIHVSEFGSFAPDGSVSFPYQLVEVGLCASQPNDTILVEAGSYHETLTIDQPISIRSSGGTAVIGDVSPSHTTLKVLTYNTHLFGDEGAGFAPTFMDSERAVLFAERLAVEEADVVGMNEVWDEELAHVFCGSVTANTCRSGECPPGSPYPFFYYCNDHDEWDDFLNSGLLLLSKYPVQDANRVFYEAEEGCGVFPSGCDGWASKGFVQATIVKEGFQFGVFITHMDAGEEQEDRDVRLLQMAELKAATFDYHATNPGAEVIVMGDFNVDGHCDPGCTEYTENLIPTMSGMGLRDGFRNAPCYDATQVTLSPENDLARLFEGPAFAAQLLDYVFYSHGNALDMLPITADVTIYRPSAPLATWTCDRTGLRCFMCPLPGDTCDPSSMTCGSSGWPCGPDPRCLALGGTCVWSDVDDLSDHYGLSVEFEVFRR